MVPFSTKADVVPVSVFTAMAPATVMLPSLVPAFLFLSVCPLWLLPFPLEEEPPGEERAVVVIVRVDAALKVTELP